MDKNILKKFAIESRQDLMKKIEVKLKTFYVDEEFSKEQKNDIYVLTNEKHSLNLTDEQYKKRELLVKRIKDLSLEQVIEEAAYTWFNRIIAIRYMEINDMLPLTKNNSSLGIRVLSSKDNKADPEIMKFTNLANPDLDINFRKEHYAKLTEESKFEYVLLLICKKLGQVIPQVFDGVTDYIDILIPDNLLNDTGFINKVVTEVPEDNFKQVEVIGWLYQYYNQTEKDRVMSEKKAYKKNEIPYATQIFTPDWIVKYMVENSLGRYWLEHTNNQSVKENWKYFINNKLENKGIIQPVDITIIDPCCGSGHILVYAFEVLYQIYQSAGYNKSDIPELILKNNIYGLDIDDRASQLSILALLLRAREYDRNIFDKDIVRNLNVMSLQESVNVQDYAINNLSETTKEKAFYLKNTFINAKEIGSLLVVEDNNYIDLIETINKEITLDTVNLSEYLLPLIKQAQILSKKYDVVVTNPPYLNNNSMSELLKEYLLENYKDSKTDLCTAFMEIRFLKEKGFISMINQQAWMFLGSFEKLRKKIISNKNISTMLHLGMGTFGADFGTTAFVLSEKEAKDGTFYRLVDYKTSEDKEREFLKIINNNDKNMFCVNNDNFKQIVGCRIGYWASDKIVESFKNKLLLDIAQTKQGLATGNNDMFLRFWFEVSSNKIKFECGSHQEAEKSNCRWFPCNKGGEYRKWYGNNYRIVEWENEGKRLKDFKGSVLRNVDFYFREGLTWSSMTSSALSMRYSPNGSIFESKGSMCFVNDKDNLYYILGVLNSKIVNNLLLILSPTLDYHEGPMGQVPIVIDNSIKEKVNLLVKKNVDIARSNWNSYEISWEFTTHPFLKYKLNNLNESYDNWLKYTEKQFNQLKQNEKEINRLFIDIYGLQDELSSNVDDKDITVSKADKLREVKSFISYAVGCMLGRYSLDEESLVFGGGNFDVSKYKTFKADIDNVIPITDESYFADDIVSRLKNFIEVVYGSGSINENIDFIAETLGKRGTETSGETIRRYFNNDFYNDHIKTYQKKPIYWLFDSGKKNGFKCLTYMHRYNDGLVAKVRLDYLHRIQTTYERLLNDVSNRLFNEDLDLNTKKELQKQQVNLSAKLQETIEYDEKIAHIANQRVEIDLDDGVTTNYSKFVYTNPKTNKSESILRQIK